MRRTRKEEIARLIERLQQSLHPDAHGMITISYYQELFKQASQAVEDLRAN